MSILLSLLDVKIWKPDDCYQYDLLTKSIHEFIKRYAEIGQVLFS